VDAVLVHAAAVVVADLPRLSGGRRGGGLENLAELRVVALLQIVERRPGRAVGRDRVVLHPAAAGELIKIHTRIGRTIQRRERNRWRLGRSLLGRPWFRYSQRRSQRKSDKNEGPQNAAHGSRSSFRRLQ